MLDKLSHIIQSALPKEMAQDMKSNIDAVIRHQLEKMNLVSMEQFEIQEKVLARSRCKIEELEKKLAELEEIIEKNER